MNEATDRIDGPRGWQRRGPYLALAILLITIATAWNAWRHDYRLGYDIAAHIHYAKVMATGRLPTHEQSTEFFTPPLSYVPAAVCYRLGLADETVAKIWQMIQPLCGVVVMIVIARSLKPLPAIATFAAFLILIGNTTWWRSLAMIRPEALLAVTIALSLYQTIQLFSGRRERWRFVVCGVLWGLACLTRQWAIPALLGVVAVSPLAPKPDRRWWIGIITAAACCAVVAGPFYLYLKLTFGSATAFNVPPAGATALTWRWQPGEAIETPVAPSLDGRPLDILHADMFGDYWMYYLVGGKTRSNNPLAGSRLLAAIGQPPKGFTSNYDTVLPDLKRSAFYGTATLMIVAAAFVGSIVAVIAMLARRKRVPPTLLVSTVAVVSTLAGYVWFVAKYSDAARTTDTVKATYLFQTWPWLVLLTIYAFGWLFKDRVVPWMAFVLVTLGLAIATSPTWFSRVIP